MQRQLRLNAHGELGDDAKRAPTTPAQRPKQVGILARVGGAEPAVGCYDRELHDAVDAQAIHRRQDAMAAALRPGSVRTPATNSEGGRTKK